ncbi:Lrp/AsnC family transcriptional regulator [Candidatus Micrarchaeota archaeon]|nr:Lrp/AsnC family transcriptional regulator [Candidatus Micrarchaeota archaeon]
MNVKLDKYDYRISYELDVNARRPVSEIAKKVGLSKQTVLNRIKKLEHSGVIQKYLTILDTSKFGYTPYKIFIRLQNVNKKSEQEIVDYIREHRNVQWFATCDGSFDLMFNVLAKDALELNRILNQLKAQYGHYIAERDIVIMLFANFYFRDYLIGKEATEVRKPMYFGAKPQQVKLDEINLKILKLLAQNARTQVVDIANRIKISPDAVRIRIKKLESAGIIQNYVLVLDNSVLGQLHYKVLLRLHTLTQKQEQRLDEFCRLHPNIYFSNKALGYVDFEVNLETRDVNEFRDFMGQLKESFSDVIRDYIILSITKVHKFDFYPMDA